MGAAGMLGRAVVAEFEAEHEVMTATRKGDEVAYGIDLTDARSVRGVVLRAAPELIVNCAAYTAVDACETDLESAFAVNAIGPKNLALAAAAIDATLFHVSTDYVFDGTKVGAYIEYDRPNPTSIYGQSKFAGEEEVRRHAGRYYIGRVQWLYGPGGRNFADTILRLADEKPSLRVVDDQFGCPTSTLDAARQIRLLVEEGDPGLYHMSARGRTSWHGFARALLDAAGRSDYRIEPCATVEFPRPAPRPANSELRNLNLELTIGDSMPPWEDALVPYLERRNA